MRRAALLFALALLGCRDQAVTIDVAPAPLPAQARSFLTVVRAPRQAPQERSGRAEAGRFRLRLLGATGAVSVYAAALDAQGCLLGDGEAATQAVEAGGRYELPVPLRVLERPACGLVVNKVGGGDGEVRSEPPGLDCRGCGPGRCCGAFAAGTAVRLTARGAEDGDDAASFGGWAGRCAGQGPCELRTGSQAVVVEAAFLRRRERKNGWQWESPLPQGNHLLAVAAGERTAWAVGGAGTILRWYGSFWAPVPTGSAVTLRAVWAAPGREDEVGWAVGDSQVLRLQEGRWRVHGSAPAQPLNGVWGRGADDVWMVGDHGLVLHWDGAALEPVPFPRDAALTTVWGAGDDLWVSGLERTLARRRGGEWQLMDVSSAPVGTFQGGADLGGGDVLVAGGDQSGLFGSTRNAGVLLRGRGDTLSEILRTPAALSTVWADGGGGAWIGGQGGYLWRYERGQVTRAASHLSTYVNLTEVHGARGNDVWAVGSAGTILHWDGSTWSSSIAAEPAPVVQLLGRSPQDLLALLKDGVVMERVGGAWRRLPRTALPGPLSGTYARGPTELFAVSGLYLWRWRFAGDASIPTGVYGPGGSVTPLRAVGGRGDTLWVVDAVGSVLRCDARVELPPCVALPPPPSAMAIRAIHADSEDSAWLVGQEGVIVRCRGMRCDLFEQLPFKPGFGLGAIWGAAPDDIWAAGNGAVVHWDGAAWRRQDCGLPVYLREYVSAIFGGAGDDVWLGSLFGEVARWDRAAACWAPQPQGTGNAIFGGLRLGSQLWIYGDGGSILRRDLGP